MISGTVGAALQGYLRDVPAIAVSVLNYNNDNIDNAARLVRWIAEKFKDKSLSGEFFLNINIPDYPINEINGIQITRQAHKTHIDTVREGHDGKHEYYWLVRRQLNNDTEKDTDIYALKEKYISITPLNETLFQRKASGLNEVLCSEIFKKIKGR